METLPVVSLSWKRVRLKSLSRLVIFEPRAKVVLEAADGRTHRETVLLIPRIEPGFEVNSTTRFRVPPWWSVGGASASL